MKKDKKEKLIELLNSPKPFIIVGLIFLMIGVVSILKFTKFETINPVPYYSTTVKKSDNYTVGLKENPYYTDKVLKKGQTYPSQLINNIKLLLSYENEGTELADYIYSYYITAEIIGDYKSGENENKQIWNRKYNLTNTQTSNTKNSSKFTIAETANINYEYYNNLVRSYEQQYYLTLNSYLKVTLNVNYTAILKESNKTITETDTVEMRIPLTETVTTVNTNYQALNNKDYTHATPVQKGDVKKLIIGGLCISISIVFFTIYTIKQNKENEENRYQNDIDKILKEYGDLIITVTNDPELDRFKVMKLEILDDLIDVAQQNQSNIIHYEKHKGKRTIFAVIQDGHAYTYTVSKNKNNKQ